MNQVINLNLENSSYIIIEMNINSLINKRETIVNHIKENVIND